MKFKLDFKVDENGVNLTHNDSVVSIGSCFSDEIGSKLISSGFSIYSNPFGTLFHPLAIMNVLNHALSNSIKVETVKRNDLFFTWEASSKLFDSDIERLRTEVLKIRSELKQNIQDSNLLILTFGTAWGYRHKEIDRLVGNCHKAPQNSFKKELSTINMMFEECQATIKSIKALNPKIKILITVSPVRHKKDGLVENNRSKARLIELVHLLVESNECIYFPAFEIVMDELRDYRFYKNDLVHPSEEAVNYVWEKFIESTVNTTTVSIISSYQKITRELAHRSLFPNSKEDINRIQKAKESKTAFTLKYPEVNWI